MPTAGTSRGNQGFTSRGRGFTQASQRGRSSSPNSQRPLGGSLEAKDPSKQNSEKIEVCQICCKPNHTAMGCWHRFDQTYQPDNFPQALAALAIHDDAWYPDTGASAHMAFDPGKLHSLLSYHGHEKIIVGNGDSLDITHVGSTHIRVGNQRIKLNDVLVAPHIKKNLLSVSQFTTDNPCTFEFSSDGFLIKGRDTRAVIAAGSRSGNLYALQSTVPQALFSNRCRIATHNIWHQRLRHPHLRIVDFSSEKYIDQQY